MTNSGKAYLVRFDNVTFEYVAKLKKYSYSATFDRENGDFFLINEPTGKSKMLFRYSNVHLINGSTNTASTSLVDADSEYNFTDGTGNNK